MTPRRCLVVVCLCLAFGPAAGPAGPVDTHPMSAGWSMMVDGWRHEIALAVLVREMALTPDQARRLLGLLRRLDTGLTGMVSASKPQTTAYHRALQDFRDRILTGPPSGRVPSRAYFEAKRAHDEIYGEIDKEQSAVRDEVAGMLAARQAQVLRSFSPERTLAGLGMDDDDLETWVQRLTSLRSVEEAELVESVRSSAADALEQVGHPERIEQVMVLVREIRRLDGRQFDETVFDHARRVKALFDVEGPKTAGETHGQLELNEAIDAHLLDMRMVPVLSTYIGERGPPTAAEDPR